MRSRERNAKYRINFNGIGPWSFCPVVARDTALEARGRDVLDRLRTWAADPRHQALVDRVMGWAYLSETRETWAIENETPSPDKERAFLQAMAQLRERRPLSEDYLVMLRDAIVTNRLHVEAGFRVRQNHLELRSGLEGRIPGEEAQRLAWVAHVTPMNVR